MPFFNDPFFRTSLRALLLVSAIVAIVSYLLPPSKTTVESYIAREGPIAKAGVLANIGSGGKLCKGARPGIVIASPSTFDPDYLYTWTRDSALVFKMLIDQYRHGIDTSTSLRSSIDDFVSSQVILQQVSNPSGTVKTGGLGEPKFNIDYTKFTEPWGRPQRDGPALRSTALVAYANYLIASGNTSHVASTLWPVIKLDLDYVSKTWNQTTFDLWEEVSSASFYTTAVQHRALREGVALANVLGHKSIAKGYTTEAQKLLCFLQSYWNPTGYITANTGGGRSGKDANTVLASIHTFDPAAGCDALTFQPCSDRALSNLVAYVDAFRRVYYINGEIGEEEPVATGRYPEDVYQGGNPWYLTTLAVAEQLYDALNVWNAQGSLEITPTSLHFFQIFSPTVTTGTYTADSSTYTALTSAIRAWADGFIAVAAKYTPSDGSLAEQYSRFNGSPMSALDLTWSYASALTTFGARSGGWGNSSWGAGEFVVDRSCRR
jgi:glucoamylase